MSPRWQLNVGPRAQLDLLLKPCPLASPVIAGGSGEGPDVFSEGISFCFILFCFVSFSWTLSWVLLWTCTLDPHNLMPLSPQILSSKSLASPGGFYYPKLTTALMTPDPWLGGWRVQQSESGLERIRGYLKLRFF